MVVHKQRDMISVIKNSVTVEIVFGNWSWEELLKKKKRKKQNKKTNKQWNKNKKITKLMQILDKSKHSEKWLVVKQS